MRQIQISEKLLSRQPNKKEKQVNDTSGKYKQKVEPPFSVGLGIYFHQQTRVKKVIVTLPRLSLTIPYDRILKTESSIANVTFQNILITTIAPSNINCNAPLHSLKQTLWVFLTIPQIEKECFMEQGKLFQKSNSKKEANKSKFTIEATNKIKFNKNV